MLHVLRRFTLAGVHYGPRSSLTVFRETVVQAKERVAKAEASLADAQAKAGQPGRDEDTDERVLDAQYALTEAKDRLERATAALAVERMPRSATVPSEVWTAQRPRVRAMLLRGKYVIQLEDGQTLGRRGSRQRRAEILAATRS